MRKHNLRLILFICAIASLSGVILGYDASVISGVIDPLTEHLNLTPWEVVGRYQMSFSAASLAHGALASFQIVSAANRH
ncbi:Uncharacterised protein [Pantoea agglomerans]|nr:hypothetical protein [Pantoea agglomerans]SUB25061.1 Uncharacterised protein [Pantoea agglomerans]